MKYKFWLILVLAQTIWASSYVVMKIALEGLPVPMVIFLRYGCVALFFVVVWLIKGLPKLNPKIILGSLLVGGLNFYGSQMLQLKGLEHTQAIDVSILILFEPMLTMLMAFVILKERISKHLWTVLIVSMLGFLLISDIHFQSNMINWSKARLYGNALFLSALFFEATCSVCGKFFTDQNTPFDAMGLLMFFGGACALVCHFSLITSYDYNSISLKTWMALVFLVLGCSVFAYTAWYYAISKVRVQFVALSLFLQPIVGSIMGYLVLGEHLSLRTFFGAMVIGVALIWWQSAQKSTQGL